MDDRQLTHLLIVALVTLTIAYVEWIRRRIERNGKNGGDNPNDTQ